MAPVGFVDALRIETLEREVRALRTATEVNEKAHQVTQIELKAVYRQYHRLLDRLGNAGNQQETSLYDEAKATVKEEAVKEASVWQTTDTHLASLMKRIPVPLMSARRVS